MSGSSEIIANIRPIEPSSPSTTTPSSPALRAPECTFQTSTPNYYKKQTQPLSVILPAPATPPIYGAYASESTVTPPPRSPGPAPASGDGRSHLHDGTSSDKSSETAVGVIRTPSAALSRKESYKAQRQHYRREKKRVASALLHSIEDPAVVVLADWLKVRGSLKSWTKLWCVLKPGLLLLYKSPKAKSSHWVGTVLLTSCQVIERPSKKDGFCFKLYHPLEQSIWAPRGPHNETIGAVVQPLPTAHLIFRAPSQAAGHCWLDGLELALKCSNAMLRCSRVRQTQTAETDAAPAALSHEELEKHFNEHVLNMAAMFPCTSPTPLMSVSDYSPKSRSYTPKSSTKSPPTPKARKITKWAQFIDTLEQISKEYSTDSQSPDSEKKDGGFLDFLRRKENMPNTSRSKSLASTPMSRSPILKCFDMPKKKPSNFVEDNLAKFMATLPKRRSSTPSTGKTTIAQKRISELRDSGAKTDSENDDVFFKYEFSKNIRDHKGAEVLCDTPDNILITKTAPSIERFRKYTSSSTDGVDDEFTRHAYQSITPDKYSLIDYTKLPSANLDTLRRERRDERFTSQSVYVAGTVLTTELAGASDSESDQCMATPTVHREKEILDRIEATYEEDPDRDVGSSGELVEDVAEENKSLLWFLLKQVRPGMDLSKVVLPTFILEPRSFLDKLADTHYHADLLAKAKSMDSPYNRFRCVLSWYLSGLYRKPKGLKKPYNPVLGESFRCCWKHDEGRTYYVAEQVSHHPPVSAFYVSNRKEGFVIEGSLLARSKFYGNSTSAILEGCARVHLLSWGETYVTTAPYAHCKGIVIGQLSMELGGKVFVTCAESGYSAEVEFKLRSFLGSAEQTNSIAGKIRKNKEVVATLDGYWDGKIDIKDKKTGETSTLLDVSVLKHQRLQRYLVKLSKQEDFESKRLWNKVSEAILKDDQVAATEAKTVIEEAQRVRARNVSTPWVPRYFYREHEPTTTDGVVDQGWRYTYKNVSPWQAEEVLEYEENFVIKTLTDTGGPVSRSSMPIEQPRLEDSRLRESVRRDPSRFSDSDVREDLARRSKTSNRTLKQSLYAIDTALREQTVALERLTRTVEAMSDHQKAPNTLRPQNVGRVPGTPQSWDLFGGFVIAMVLQALLNWIFYHQD